MAWWPFAAQMGGSLLSSYFANQGMSEGSDAYQKMMEEALQNYQQHEQQGRSDINTGFNRGVSYLAPYMGAGSQGLSDYMASLGEGGAGSAVSPGLLGSYRGAGEAQQGVLNKFRTSPGYQFALQQGTNAINQNAAARGLAGSGGTLKALTQYGQNLADQQYGQYQNRLQGLATQGQQASGQAMQGSMQAGNELANLGLNYAQDEGGLYSGMGAQSANTGMAGGFFNSNMVSQLMPYLMKFFGGNTPAGGNPYYGGNQWTNPDTGNWGT